MKTYERISQNRLTPRMPAIIRIDGRAFHTLLKGAFQPFDPAVQMAMINTAQVLLSEVSTARMVYTQSDEISILLMDYNKFDSQQWFDGKVQKICSIAASIATAEFNECHIPCKKKVAHFDARVFSIPKDDVNNYFVWRQRDWLKNSLQMVARSLYSHKELHKKKSNELHDMIYGAGDNWNNYSVADKRGTVVTKMNFHNPNPEFSQVPEFVEGFLRAEEE